MNIFLQETGCKVLAILQIISEIIVIFVIIYVAAHAISDTHGSTDLDLSEIIKYTLVAILFVICIMTCSILLYIGVKKRNKNFLIPTLVLFVIGTIGGILDIVILGNYLAIFGLALNLYLGWSIYKLYQLFVIEENNRILTLNHIHGGTGGGTIGNPGITYFTPLKDVPLNDNLTVKNEKYHSSNVPNVFIPCNGTTNLI